MRSGPWILAVGIALGLAGGRLLPPRVDAPPSTDSPPAGRAAHLHAPRPDAPASTRRLSRGHEPRMTRGPASADERFDELISLLRNADDAQFLDPLKLSGCFGELGQLGQAEAIDLLTRIHELPDEERPDNDDLNLAVLMIFGRLSQLNGPAAMKLLVDPRLEELWDYEPETFASAGMNVWTSRDPEGARRWFDSLIQQAEALAATHGDDAEFDGVLELLDADEFRQAYMRGMARLGPEGLETSLAAISHPDARAQVIDDQWLARVQIETTPEGLVTLLPELAGRHEALSVAITRLLRLDPDAATSWIESQPAGPAREPYIRDVAAALMEENTDAGIEWYLSQPIPDPERQERRLADIVSKLAATDPDRADEWVRRQPDDAIRDEAEAELARHLAQHGEWSRAFHWLAEIEDASTRSGALELMKFTGRNFYTTGISPEALEAADDAGFGDEVRAGQSNPRLSPLGR